MKDNDVPKIYELIVSTSIEKPREFFLRIWWAPAQPNKTPKAVDFAALNFLLTAARFRILSIFHSYALPILRHNQ